MKTSSCKAKARQLQNEVVDKLRLKYIKPFEYHVELVPIMGTPIVNDDIKPAIMGMTGTDIILSPAAKLKVPFDIECKRQENISIWSALKQTEANTKDNRIPLLVFSRNRSKTYAVIELDKLLEIIN